MVYSNRASGKARGGDTGQAYAIALLVKYGAEPPARGEEVARWVETWRDRLTRPHRHRGNHRYVWSLSDRRRDEIIPKYGPRLPYPKFDSNHGA